MDWPIILALNAVLVLLLFIRLLVKKRKVFEREDLGLPLFVSLARWQLH